MLYSSLKISNKYCSKANIASELVSFKLIICKVNESKPYNFIAFEIIDKIFIRFGSK